MAAFDGSGGILGMSFLNDDGAYIGQCINCAHYNGSRKCDAFPEGIPQAVFDDVVDHGVHIPGDNGLRFQEKNQMTAEEAIEAVPVEEGT